MCIRDRCDIDHLAVYSEYTDTQLLLFVDLLNYFLSKNDILLGWCEDLMYDIDLTWVDNGCLLYTSRCV